MRICVRRDILLAGSRENIIRVIVMSRIGSFLILLCSTRYFPSYARFTIAFRNASCVVRRYTALPF